MTVDIKTADTKAADTKAADTKTGKAPLLTVDNLAVTFRGEEGETTPVRNVSLRLDANETLAIVGESGSGKSVTSLAVMGLLPRNAGRVSGGRIDFTRRDGETLDLAQASPDRMRRLRGSEIAMIFQEPMTSLNPVLSVGEQIAEAARLHLGHTPAKARAHAVEMLRLVEIADAGRRVDDYPHHMSGGMRQRVMIALAMACNPALLIADEPTTALDVTIQAQVLKLIDRLRRETGMGVLFITHNLGVVAEIADRVSVVYAGEVVESAGARDLFRAPAHPYTRALLACLPARATRDDAGRRVLRSIPGQVAQVKEGCAFAPRCASACTICGMHAPKLEEEGDRAIRCLRWREVA